MRIEKIYQGSKTIFRYEFLPMSHLFNFKYSIYKSQEDIKHLTHGQV